MNIGLIYSTRPCTDKDTKVVVALGSIRPATWRGQAPPVLTIMVAGICGPATEIARLSSSVDLLRLSENSYLHIV